MNRLYCLSFFTPSNLVSWIHPGQGQRLNPLEPVGVTNGAAYAELVLEWLAALGIDETLTGTPTYRLLHVILKLWGGHSLTVAGEPLSPALIASLLESQN